MKRCHIVLVAPALVLLAAPTIFRASVPDEPVDYSDPAVWVCRPDVDDVCDTELDVTVVAADGTLTAEPFVPDPDAPVDCFYVYPTISRDETTNSDLVADEGEEGYAARNQVAPLGTECRVFAPVYRQVTLAGLAEVLGGGNADPNAREIAFDDVLTAWRHYLANDNDGRGVVLIGHSQGAGILNRLIQEEVETNPEQLDLLVAAYIAGSGVQVPRGEVVGGDFQEVPLCQAPDQFGCALTWVSYRSTVPPPEAAIFGLPGEDTVAGCTNPASLGGGEAFLAGRFPSSADASILTELGTDAEGASWVEPSAGTIDTPFVELPGLVTGRCVTWDRRNWLEVTVHGDPADPRADDISGDITPEWGLHLIDVNLVMGDLQRLVESQGEAWLAAH